MVQRPSSLHTSEERENGRRVTEITKFGPFLQIRDNHFCRKPPGPYVPTHTAPSGQKRQLRDNHFCRKPPGPITAFANNNNKQNKNKNKTKKKPSSCTPTRSPRSAENAQIWIGFPKKEIFSSTQKGNSEKTAFAKKRPHHVKYRHIPYGVTKPT